MDLSRPADDSTGKRLSLRASKQTQLAHVQHGAGILAGLENGAATRYRTTIECTVVSVTSGGQQLQLGARSAITGL